MSFCDPLHSSRLLGQNFGLGITPDDIIVPTYSFYNPNYYRHWKVFMQNAVEDVGSAISNEKDKFKISLDVQQFRPNEITVKTTKTEVIIEGKHEERADEHGYVSRQFIRKYKIPDYCDPDSVTSCLTKDGVLIVTAVKKCLEIKSEQEKIIPIVMCETCPKMAVSVNKVSSKIQNDLLEEKCSKRMNRDENILDQIKTQNLRDDHCSLLNKDGSLKASMHGSSDKFKNESKLESSEEIVQISGGKFDRSNMVAKNDLSGFSRMSSESMQSKEASFSTSMSYDMKSSTEQTTEYINEIISKELKSAAENL